MDLINQFIENYKKKLTFYEILGRISSSQLEDALQSAGIRAMVTYRIKNPGRLKSKILRRNVKRTVPYKNMKEIYEDIADLCGIRVSLYFPGDRVKVDSLISDLFQVIERKQFPEQSKPPTYNKRFFRLLGQSLPGAYERGNGTAFRKTLLRCQDRDPGGFCPDACLV